MLLHIAFAPVNVPCLQKSACWVSTLPFQVEISWLSSCQRQCRPKVVGVLVTAVGVLDKGTAGVSLRPADSSHERQVG